MDTLAWNSARDFAFPAKEMKVFFIYSERTEGLPFRSEISRGRSVVSTHSRGTT